MTQQQKFLDKLISSLKNEPEKWEFDRFYATNHEWGISIWIANDFWFVKVKEPTEITFNLIDKIYLWSALKECRAASLLLKKKTSDDRYKQKD